jgi:Do/DeqQ family serine protease
MVWRRTWLIFSQAVTVAVATLFVVTTLKPEWLPGGAGGRLAPALPAPTFLQGAAEPVSPAATPASAPALATGFALAARRAAPAVVSVTATRMARNPHANDPRFREFFGSGGPQARAQVGLGSGVIVSPQGYLLTNHHVIQDATEIEVQLNDGRQVQARVVGSDPETDIAVLKIALTALPVMELGNFRNVQVGDAVLAIGNPFAVGQTVTAGIVSALGRVRVGGSPLQNFIQTDAAINPGNSGGALVDAGGRLVGINTAIFSRGGSEGNLGIGFAVPVDIARQVMEQLIKDGRVHRGWLGLESRDLSADLAESLNLPVKAGALVTGVLQDGPAAKGGIRPGDVVVRIGDTVVGSSSDLLAGVAALPPDSKTRIAVQRGAQALQLDLQVADRAANLPRPAR